MGIFIDLTGQIVRNFSIVKRAENSKFGRVRWLCHCICGKEVIMHGSKSAFLRKRSCGCKRNIQHGHRRTKCTSPEYQSWRAMRSRCLNPKDTEYSNYGGRGISVCKRWNSFVCFLEDMGSRPEDMTLDRIHSNGNYEPKNCRWAASTDQAKNRRPRFAIESFSDEDFLREFYRRFYGRKEAS